MQAASALCVSVYICVRARANALSTDFLFAPHSLSTVLFCVCVDLKSLNNAGKMSAIYRKQRWGRDEKKCVLQYRYMRYMIFIYFTSRPFLIDVVDRVSAQRSLPVVSNGCAKTSGFIVCSVSTDVVI